MFKAATLARTCLAGLALVVLSASLAKAIYGPRTTIGKNYQQFSNTMSTNGIDQAQCVNAENCYVLFQLTPQQKPLTVQHVSCRVTVGVGEIRQGKLLTRKGQDFMFRQTVLVPVPTSSTWWAVNSPVMHLVKSGERPIIFFQNSPAASWALECSISGRLQ